MELSIVLQPWMVVPAFTTFIAIVARVLAAQDGYEDSGWLCFVFWIVMTVPALLVVWIK
jgi:hypothetical protein